MTPRRTRFVYKPSLRLQAVVFAPSSDIFLLFFFSVVFGDLEYRIRGQLLTAVNAEN